VKARRREPAPGVFRLVLPLRLPGLRAVNAYLLRDEAGFTLVDCGIHDRELDPEGGWAHLCEALAACDARPEQVTRLIVTHHHVDHYGLAARLIEEARCELWMHRLARDDLRLYRDPGVVAGRLRALFASHGAPQEDLDELTAFEDWRRYVSGVVEPDRMLEGGEEVTIEGRRWSVEHTPGHARGHVCLFAPADALLLSGDHLLPAVTPHIDVTIDAADPLGDYLASLARIEKLSPSLVLPGHGRPFEGGAERARATLRHHDRRLGAILQVIRREPASAAAVSEEIFGSALLDLHKRLALGEALAHLVYLERRSEVERSDADGVIVYRKSARRPDARP
jgi:glyoxylase-like metal-dependent hydrolase (beta-lactamase superfamily II)